MTLITRFSPERDLAPQDLGGRGRAAHVDLYAVISASLHSRIENNRDIERLEPEACWLALRGVRLNNGTATVM